MNTKTLIELVELIDSFADNGGDWEEKTFNEISIMLCDLLSTRAFTMGDEEAKRWLS